MDPVAPLSSPVTKTYSRTGVSPAAKQRENDAFDLMVTGTSPRIRVGPVTDTDTPVHGHSTSDDGVEYDTRYDPSPASHPHVDVTFTPFTSAHTHTTSNALDAGDTTIGITNSSPTTGSRSNVP